VGHRSQEKAVAADKQVTLQGLASNTEKALKRGKKLEKALLKVVAQSTPGSAAEEFLKSVQQGLKALKKESKKTERSLSLGTTKAPSRKEPGPNPEDTEKKPRRSASQPRRKARTTPEQASETP
jgi:hypothetical protein